MLRIEKILTKKEVKEIRQTLDAAPWEDGKLTAGMQSAASKKNLQIAPQSNLGKELSTYLLKKLGQHPLFNSAVLPLRLVPPLFNRYDKGMFFGEHVDNALRPIPHTGYRIRTDVSSTLFLSEPEEYDGGELILYEEGEQTSVKLPAGDMIVYPTYSLHAVTEVTRGSRIGSFFWSQSVIRSDEKRKILFELDQSIQSLTMQNGFKDKNILRLTNIYHNLLRQWAEM